MKTGIGTAMLLTVCLGIAGSTTAQIYRHVDEHGVVHFSDTPAAQDAQVVDQADLDALTTTVPGTALPDPAQQRAADRAREQARTSRTAALRRAQKARNAEAARCEGYRSRLDGIQSQLRAGYRIDEGNRLRAQRRELTALIARECRGR